MAFPMLIQAMEPWEIHQTIELISSPIQYNFARLPAAHHIETLLEIIN